MRTASRSNAGIFFACSGLVRAQVAQPGVIPAVFAAADQDLDADRPAWGGAEVHALKAIPPAAFGYMPDLAADLARFAPDVVHQHGLWLYQSIVAKRSSRQAGSRTVISIHGMMSPFAMRHSGMRKQVALRLYERGNIAAADCLHALSATEAEQARALGFENPICVIPNGIYLPDLDRFRSREDRSSSKRTLLYLGRLHPIKGVDDLLRGWARFKSQAPNAADWQLVVAGWGDPGYRAELEALANSLELGEGVVFTGGQHGDDLWRTYAVADAYILPSRSEAMPMTILEAWACGLPVIMTPECGLEDGVACGAAVVTERDASSMGDAIGRIAAMSDSARTKMGAAGRRLVETRFTWERAAQKFDAVYSWLLNGGLAPESVSQ